MKKQIVLPWIAISIFFCIQNIAYGQNRKSGTIIHESIRHETNNIFDKLVEIRRDLHKYPELSSEERRTQEVIKRHLLDLGLRVETDIYGYGIVGILEGSKKGKTIAWRADMDALSDDNQDNVDFKSMTKGVKHSCGHDVHMTIALGIAEVLAKYKSTLQGTVYFIFQPEEETFKGAKGMLENDFVNKHKIDEIYGLHVIPAPAGQMMIKPDAVYAYQRGVKIELKKEFSQEKIKALAAEICNSLLRYKDGSRPWEMDSFTDPEIGIGSRNSIYQDFLIAENWGIYSENDRKYIYIQLFGTDLERMRNITPVIEQVVEDQNYLSELVSISQIIGNPVVVNDPRLTSSSINILDSIYGKGFLTSSYGQIPYSNDDFAYFQQIIPGVYFLLGGSNIEKQIIAMPHASNFEVDEECIRTGVSAFSSLTVERLK